MDDALAPGRSEAVEATESIYAETAPDARRSRRSRGPHVLLIDGDEATRKAIAAWLASGAGK